MAAPASRSPRRTDALTRERIIAAAVELLDVGGENALTVRALTSRLATGRGAIYHHIASMSDLLAATADQVLEEVIRQIADRADAESELRELAVSLFDSIRDHPWIGTQLGRDPSQPAVFRLWKTIAVTLKRMGLHGRALSDSGGALVSYVLGAVGQYSANNPGEPDAEARQRYLDDLAAAWRESDRGSIVDEAASELQEHDDRDQFIAGMNIFIIGLGHSS